MSSSPPRSINGIPSGFQAQMLSWLGGPIKRRLAQWGLNMPQLDDFEREMQGQSDRDLKKRSLSLRFRAKSGEKLAKIMPEAYALVREASRRTLGMRHYDVQLIGGMALFNGCIAEMETGEGKTLTASLPMYLHALIGKGAHL